MLYISNEIAEGHSSSINVLSCQLVQLWNIDNFIPNKIHVLGPIKKRIFVHVIFDQKMPGVADDATHRLHFGILSHGAAKDVQHNNVEAFSTDATTLEEASLLQHCQRFSQQASADIDQCDRMTFQAVENFHLAS